MVRLDLANGGGIYSAADVTYRGVSVGRVGAMRLTGNGIEVDLDISDSAPRIPASLQAAVADLSAVGEQYVDLRPQTPGGPYLHSGSVIPERDTELPIAVTSLLNSVNMLATSLPLSSLRELTNELAAGFGGQGGNVASIVSGNAALIHAANATLRQTKRLSGTARRSSTPRSRRAANSTRSARTCSCWPGSSTSPTPASASSWSTARRPRRR